MMCCSITAAVVFSVVGDVTYLTDSIWSVLCSESFCERPRYQNNKLTSSPPCLLYGIKRKLYTSYEWTGERGKAICLKIRSKNSVIGEGSSNNNVYINLSYVTFSVFSSLSLLRHCSFTYLLFKDTNGFKFYSRTWVKILCRTIKSCLLT